METTEIFDRLKSKNRWQKIFIAILVIVILIVLGAVVYFYNQNRELKKNPQKTAAKETEQIIDLVGKLIVLPEGEEPTVATVADLEKLKDQPFFAKAKVGDRLLIYTNASKAILYDPVQNKIVEVAPLNIKGQEQVQQ